MAGGLEKYGTGTWTLGGAVSHTGNTTINDGTLEINGGGQFGGGNYLGNISIGNGDSLIWNSTADQIISGNITDASNNGTLTKDNTGTLTLSGTVSHGGATNVDGGELLINGDASGATGAINVNNASTLGGEGTIGGSVTIAANANIAPGAAGAAGTITINGNLDISALSSGTGLLNFDLDAVGSSDKIISDSADVGGLGFANFNFTELAGFGGGDYILISTNTPITGALAGTTGTIDGLDAELKIVGNTLVLSVVADTTTIEVDGGGNLVITDTDGTIDNQYVITSDGSTVTITDLSGETIGTGGLATSGEGTGTVTIDFVAAGPEPGHHLQRGRRRRQPRDRLREQQRHQLQRSRHHI